MARQVLTLPDVPPTLLTQSAGDARYLPITYTPPPGVDAYTKSEADARFVNVTGNETMAGSLTIQSSNGLSIKGASNTYPVAYLSDYAIGWGPGNTFADTSIVRDSAGVLLVSAQWSPDANNSRDLGNSSLGRWRALYCGTGNFSGNVTVSGNVDVSGSNGVTLAEGNRVFRHGANNYGTMIYAKFGYGGDGNNPRMTFGNNSWFPQHGGSESRPSPVKDVSGLASSLMIFEAAGSGGQPDGQVKLVDIMWQDGGWTTGYWTPFALNNKGTLKLSGGTDVVDGNIYLIPRSTDAGHMASVGVRRMGNTALTRIGQAVNGSRFDLTANSYYDGTNWNLDDTTLYGTVIQSSGANAMAVYSVSPGANPITAPRMKQRLLIDANGTASFNPDAGFAGIATNAPVGLGTAAYPNWNASYRVIDFPNMGIYTNAASANTLELGVNSYVHTDGNRKAKVGSIPGCVLQFQGDQMIFFQMAQVAQDTTQTAVPRFQVNNAGMYWNHPSGPQFAVGAGAANGNARVGSNAANSRLEAYGTGFVPFTDGFMFLGETGYRWAQIYSSSGSISTSHVSLKHGFTRLDPVACAAAVMHTDWLSFVYNDPPLPPREADDDDEKWEAKQAGYQEMLERTAVGRQQKGYVLGSEEYKTDDLFGMADRYSASTHADLAVVACALQAALLDIAELKARLP